MPKPKKLPRGFWNSPEGRKALSKLSPNGSLTAADLARELGTTEAAVYNASSKRKRVITGQPMLVDQGFIDRVIRFAEDILGDAVTTRVRQLQDENETLRADNTRLQTELDQARTTTREQASTLESMQGRLAERVLKVAGPAKGD